VLKCCSETGGDIAAAEGLLLCFDDRVVLLFSWNPLDANFLIPPGNSNRPVGGIEDGAVQGQATVGEVEHSFP